MEFFVTNNKTPFHAFVYKSHDRSVVTAVKATFRLIGDGGPVISDDQVPLFFGDEYYGEPESTSLKYASDIVPEKAGTDIALVGHAYAKQGKAVRTLTTSLQVGPLRKDLYVIGDTVWKQSFLRMKTTKPEPFTKMPITYELAFGGFDTTHKKKHKHGFCLENPVGTGFAMSKNKQRRPGMKRPNIFTEKQSTKKDNPIPAGYGFIAPYWSPRNTFSGINEKDRPEKELHKIADSFSPKFYNAASPDLIAEPFLSGNEQIHLKNLHPEKAEVHISLPGLSMTTAYITEHRTYKPPAVLDTLLIEPDENRFTLVWRSKIPEPDRLNPVKQVNIYE